MSFFKNKQINKYKYIKGARVTFDIALPAAISLLVARAIGSLLVGSTREERIKMEIRQAYLREMFNKQAKRGISREYGVTSSLYRNDSEISIDNKSSKKSLNDLNTLSNDKIKEGNNQVK